MFNSIEEYRSICDTPGLRSMRTRIRQSDLLIRCDCTNPSAAEAALARARRRILEEISSDPLFLLSLDPLAGGYREAGVASRMRAASAAWGVGPMAAVAGAVADEVASGLLDAGAGSVMVENGGDVFARGRGTVRFAIHAGATSPFGGCFVLETEMERGVGICTSSATVGHSLSLGGADSVTAIAGTAAEADAAATSIANRIAGEDDVESVVDDERRRGSLRGLFACAGGRAGFWGDFSIVGLFAGRE